ncbi:hypothetical protein ACTXT7_004540, partial [Hymenolepis weldensis]
IPDNASNSCQNLDALRKQLRSRYPASTSKPKTDPMDIYLDACYPLPLESLTPETQRNRHPGRYSGRFRTPRKKLKVELAFEIMDE